MSATTTTVSVDLEAQTRVVAGVYLPLPAHINITRLPPTETATNPVDDFFGHTLSASRTLESRHDRRLSESDSTPPPPYTEVLPAYSRKAEPTTLAHYLFKFGFLFPPFWILGAFILLSPLRAPPESADPELAWLPEKTEAERQEIIASMRKAELKWAKRCLWALLIVVFVGVAVGIAVWAALRA